MEIRLVIVLCVIALSACTHSFREEDVATAKTRIQREFQKQGFTVKEVGRFFASYPLSLKLLAIAQNCMKHLTKGSWRISVRVTC